MSLHFSSRSRYVHCHFSSRSCYVHSVTHLMLPIIIQVKSRVVLSVLTTGHCLPVLPPTVLLFQVGKETNKPFYAISKELRRLQDRGRACLVERCFTSTETVGLLGTGAQDGHLDFHTGLRHGPIYI